jgi:hypothetical protein
VSENGTAPPAPRHISAAPIRPLDPAQFGKKAELADKLKSILKDVPVLHERMTKAVADFEEVTRRANAIVTEWERVNAESKA